MAKDTRKTRKPKEDKPERDYIRNGVNDPRHRRVDDRSDTYGERAKDLTDDKDKR